MENSHWTPTLPAGFCYDPVAHRYTLDGRPLAGLTRMLEDCGYYPFSEWYTERSRARGTAVHKACELVDIHGAARVDIDPRIQPEVSAYLAFKDAHDFQPIAHETPVCSAVYRMACTPDIPGYIRGKLAVIDLKSWRDSRFRVQRGAELQTAGQALMLEECGLPPVEERYILQLTGRPERPWKLFPCTNPRDRMTLLNLAAVWWDRYEAGLLKNFRPPVIESAVEDAEEAADGEVESAWA